MTLAIPAIVLGIFVFTSVLLLVMVVARKLARLIFKHDSPARIDDATETGNGVQQRVFTFAHPRGPDITVQKKFWCQLKLLQSRELLAKGRYTIKSDVDREVVELFFDRVVGDDTAVATAKNAEQLRELSDELGFTGFDDEIRAFLDSNWKVRKDLVSMRQRVDRHDVTIEHLQRCVLNLEQQIREQQTVPERVKAVEGFRDAMEPVIQRVSREVRALRQDVLTSSKESTAEVAALSDEVSRFKADLGDMWQAVQRLKSDASSKEFVYKEVRPLDGIIAHLTRECGGNVHKQGIVNVTASGCFGGQPEYAVDLKSDSCF